jgi:hypothetical protein
VARHAYKSEKRRKETARLKKQEEKRQRRFGAKAQNEGDETETTNLEGAPEEETAAEGQEGTEEKEESAREGA